MISTMPTLLQPVHVVLHIEIIIRLGLPAHPLHVLPMQGVVVPVQRRDGLHRAAVVLLVLLVRRALYT